LLGLPVNLMAVGEDFFFTAVVAIVGCNEADGVVQVLGVVPQDEGVHPRLSLLDEGKGLGRILGTILHRAGQDLGIRVVIADPGRENEVTTPRFCIVASMAAPFMGRPLSA
jgi:hypothetical protein